MPGPLSTKLQLHGRKPYPPPQPSQVHRPLGLAGAVIVVHVSTVRYLICHVLWGERARRREESERWREGEEGERRRSADPSPLFRVPHGLACHLPRLDGVRMGIVPPPVNSHRNVSFIVVLQRGARVSPSESGKVEKGATRRAPRQPTSLHTCLLLEEPPRRTCLCRPRRTLSWYHARLKQRKGRGGGHRPSSGGLRTVAGPPRRLTSRRDPTRRNRPPSLGRRVPSPRSGPSRVVAQTRSGTLRTVTTRPPRSRTVSANRPPWIGARGPPRSCRAPLAPSPPRRAPCCRRRTL